MPRIQNNIQELTIFSNYGGQLNLLGLGSINEVIFFQSLLDDTVRAYFKVYDSGARPYTSGSVDMEEPGDIKITSGEKVSLAIQDENGTTISTSLLIEHVTSSSSDTMIETFDISLCSEDYIKNQWETHRCRRNYQGKISETVEIILTEDLKTSQAFEIDETLNFLPVNGHYDTPLDLITILAPKSIPAAHPEFSGYLFFNTYEGYKFKSIDVLHKQGPKRKMIANRTARKPPGYDNNIVAFSFQNSMDIFKSMRSSTMSKVILKTFDEYTNEYPDEEETLYDGNTTIDGGSQNLGSERPLVATSIAYQAQTSSIVSQFYNTGTLPPGFTLPEQLPFSKEPTFDLEGIVRKSIARYNQVFLLRATLVIEPGDFGIFPGDIIFCDFPEISPKDLRLQVSQKKSGRYMVQDIAHCVNGETCYSRLNIVKDTIMV